MNDLTTDEAAILDILLARGAWTPLPAQKRDGQREVGEGEMHELARRGRAYVRIAVLPSGTHARITIPGQQALARYGKQNGHP